MDQNEKMVMYGVTHVMAVDGYSRKIVGMVTMPVKNAITIYHTLFRPLLLTKGLWDQIRVDHSSKFALVSTTQQHLAGYHHQQSRPPLLQSSSRQNLRVERLWVEVNQRINYPIKRVLVEMESQGEIDMTDDLTKFCVSWTTIHTIEPAVKNFIAAWNDHRLPGCRGSIPSILARRNNQTTHLDSSTILTTTDAISLHEQLGGHLTRESQFGCDPLASYPNLSQLRERDFHSRYPNIEELMECVLGGNLAVFKQALIDFIELTRSFSSLVQINS